MGTLITRVRKLTRARRLRTFREFLARIGHSPSAARELRILDIGGTVPFWEEWWQVSSADRLCVTLVNNHAVDTTLQNSAPSHAFIRQVNTDANLLRDHDFAAHDIIFSNSFFEHLESRAQQKALAGKILASGKPYFIQVPNKNSPIDPHHPFAPFFAVYPRGLRARLLTISAFGPSRRASSLEAARLWQQHYTPLGITDMRSLFPTSHLMVEKPGGIPMSILASHTAA